MLTIEAIYSYRGFEKSGWYVNNYMPYGKVEEIPYYNRKNFFQTISEMAETHPIENYAKFNGRIGIELIF